MNEINITRNNLYHKLVFFLFFIYLLSPEYIVGFLYIQDIIAILSFVFWILLGRFKVSLPRVFVWLLIVPAVHLVFYGFLNSEGVWNEIQSFGREFFIIFMCVSFSVELLRHRHTYILFFVVFTFLTIDFLQSIRLYYFHNFSMQQYYDSIDIVLNLPRYVYYRDHISFTPLIVFLTTLALFPVRNRWGWMSFFSIFYLMILQSRTYLFYIINRVFFNLNKNLIKILFFMVLCVSFFLGIWAFDFTLDSNSKLIKIITDDGLKSLFSDVALRVNNWIAWLKMIVDEFLIFGIGSYGIANKNEFIFLSEVYAIDNILVRELVRYGVFGFFKLMIIFVIFIKTFDKKIPPENYNFVIFIRYIIFACLVNDLLSNVIVRACFYTSVAVVYKTSISKTKQKVIR